MRRFKWGVAVLAVGFVATSGPVGDSHTPIASRWNYKEHLFPVFRDNCGACHRTDGIAPMSLMTYREAFPWSQSIREEVLGLRMPPWKAEDGFGDFRNGHSLPAHEMDMILEWSSGGYPQGPRTLELPAVTGPDGWELGPPAIALRMAEPFVLDAGTSATVRYFVLPTGISDALRIAGVDILPEAGAVVRGAMVYFDAEGTARQLDEADDGPGFATPDASVFPVGPPVAVWSPGQQPIVQEGVARTLPAGADVVLRVHYRKTWITEGQEFHDRTAVGLYAADGDVAGIESLVATSPAALEGQEVSFTHTLDEDARLLALFPEIDVEATDVRVIATTPDGTEIPMLFLREPNAAWPTRYWFDTAIDVPRGTELTVAALLPPAAEYTPSVSLLGIDSAPPIRLLVDYAPATAPANDD